MLMTQESFDPDLNLQLLNDHGIYTIEEINELSRTGKPQFSAIHLNLRSLKQHFDEIFNLLDSISCKFDFIACSETWFASETDNTCFQILSINQGIFPDSTKFAKVVTIFKQGSRFVCNNYRPIPVLSSISKIFEKCIFNQLMFYFTNNKMISPKQHGFRPGVRTSDCLIDLIEEITSSLDQGHYVVSLFLDLSKAFDTVNYPRLLNKLKFYGLQQSEYNWFQAYLSKRKQQVYVNGIASDSCVISTGVPQGSILGPLLFIIFINDLPKISTFFLLDYMQMILL